VQSSRRKNKAARNGFPTGQIASENRSDIDQREQKILARKGRGQPGNEQAYRVVDVQDRLYGEEKLGDKRWGGASTKARSAFGSRVQESEKRRESSLNKCVAKFREKRDSQPRIRKGAGIRETSIRN